MRPTPSLLLVLIIVIGAGLYFVADVRRDARADIETDRRIEDARDACPDDLPWRERLRCAVDR